MLKNKFNDIFHNVQQNVSSHQKYRQILLKLYKEVPSDDFEIELMRCIELLFSRDITPKNVFVNRSLEFIGSFVGSVMNEGAQLDADTTINNVFLESILTNIIAYHSLDNVAVRFHCCQLIHLLFSSLGENVLIDSDLWDLVSDPLLERLKDVKPNIRAQAAQALSRFQLPNDPTCKVVSAFVDRLYDINASVRKEIVHLIAPTKLTFPKIAERVKDTDYGVRLVAFRKCATVGPKVFMINTRQSILMSGFYERHNIVKIYFQQELVPSWLDAYNGDYLKFLDALKLDSSEEDIKHSEIVCNHVLLLFFKSDQLGTIIEKFPLDENKVIPMDKLNYQSSLLWYSLVDYLRELDNSEDYLDLIIPELTLFCAYIERVVDENCKVDGWKYYEHQHNLLQLFKIAKSYDFSDEVGRKCLRKLVVDLLTTKKLSERVILMMITILSLITPNLDLLTTDICHIISEISEPMVVQTQQPTANELMQRNYQLAQLNVKINELMENKEDAVLNKNYTEAARLKSELEIIQKKHDELTNEFNKQTAKPVFNEVDVTLRCLDILIGVLSLPKLRTLTISLRTCKDEFLPPLFDLDNNEINHKVFKSLSLFCTLDKDVAQHNLKLICTPLFLYRVTPHENMHNLLVSIATISDLLRLFGVELLRNDSMDDSSADKSAKHRHNGTRRLYTIEQSGATESIDDLITSDNIFEIMLELLDDEQAELRHQAARALSELVMAKITLSPTIISRLIIKWLLSALEEREEVKLQQIIGNALFYLMKLEEGGEIYERTVIPVLNCIGNAPRTSPVADIDIENAVTFLAALTSIHSETQFVNIHKNLAYSLCYKIRDKLDDKNVPLYIRMLVSLSLNLDNPCNVRELIDQVEGILEKISDKMSKRYLEKFLLNLKQMSNEQEAGNEEKDESRSEKTNDDNEKDKENSSINHQIENSNENAATGNEASSVTKNGRREISKDAENSNQRRSLRQPESRKSIIEDMVTLAKTRLQSEGDVEKKSDQRGSLRKLGSHKSLVADVATSSGKKRLQSEGNDVQEKPDQRKSLRQLGSNKSPVEDRVMTAKKRLQSKSDVQEKSDQRKRAKQPECRKLLVVDLVPLDKKRLHGRGDNQENPGQRKSPRQLESRKSLVDLVTLPDKNLQLQCEDRSNNKKKLSGRPLSSESSVEEQVSPLRKSVRQAKGDANVSPGQNKKKKSKKKLRRSESNSISSTQSSEELNPRKSLRLSQNSIVTTPSPKSLELNTRKGSKRAESNLVNTPNQEPKSTKKSSKCTNHVNISRVKSSDRLSSKTSTRVFDNSASSNSQVKRRKRRGKLSGNSVTSIGSRYSDVTILHTIVLADDEELEKLEDDNEDNMSIRTPTTTESQSSRSSTRSITRSKSVAVTETSSDSEPPLRKSARKLKLNSKYHSDESNAQRRRNRREI